MQIEKRGLNRLLSAPGFVLFSENELEKVSSEMFLPVSSVPLDLNPDKESLSEQLLSKAPGLQTNCRTAR